MSPLKECPKCQSNGALAHRRAGHYYVRCENCGFYNATEYWAFATKEAAIRDWNEILRTPRVIEFTKEAHPGLVGRRACITFDDGEYLRVTPLDGNPLASIELKVGAANYKEVE